MEDKIEVNEYVRTNNKGIKRIDRIDNNKTVNKYLYFTGIEDFEGKEYGIIKTTEIVKHRKKIDLIEVGDFVNGMKILHIEDNKLYVELNNEFEEFTGFLENKDIKTILTKEQFEANCYKVGGEDE